MSGTRLLDEIHDALATYVVLPTPEAYVAVTLWIVATHAIDSFNHAARLVIVSPEKRCGKSRLLDLIAALCANALVTVNASTAAVFRRIGEGTPPTLLVDEADTIFGSKKVAETNEELRGLINAGHQRNRPALRCVGPLQIPTEFSTFAMVALAGIGAMPDTITDRAVNVTMRRRAPGEQVQPFRHRRDAEPLQALRDQLAAWVATQLDELASYEPEMPLEDRAADTWEPLISVADMAGGDWPAKARKAAVVMTSEQDSAATEASLGVRLLADIAEILATYGDTVISSEHIVGSLRAVEEAPWAAFDFDQRGLARRLRPYGITSDRIRPDGGNQVRGYKVADFADAFSRYLVSPSVTPSQNQQPRRSDTVSGVTLTDRVTDTSVTTSGSVTSKQASDLHQHPDCDAVTDRDGQSTDDDPWAKPLPVKCAVCGEPMPVIEPGQTTHPGCDAAVAS